MNIKHLDKYLNKDYAAVFYIAVIHFIHLYDNLFFWCVSVKILYMTLVLLNP